jgi:hypothetical protein
MNPNFCDHRHFHLTINPGHSQSKPRKLHLCDVIRPDSNHPERNVAGGCRRTWRRQLIPSQLPEPDERRGDRAAQFGNREQGQDRHMRREYGCDCRLRARVAYDVAQLLEDVIHRLPTQSCGACKESVSVFRLAWGLRGAIRRPPYGDVPLAARREAREEIRGRDPAKRINEQFVERVPSIRAPLFRFDRRLKRFLARGLHRIQEPSFVRRTQLPHLLLHEVSHLQGVANGLTNW